MMDRVHPKLRMAKPNCLGACPLGTKCEAFTRNATENDDRRTEKKL